MLILSGFVIGLIGSMHCLGMCGPILIALPQSNKGFWSKTASLLVYHAGRILVYGILGLLFGIAGKGLSLAGLQRWLSIIAGALMIVLILFPRIFKRFGVTQRFSNVIYSKLQRLWSKNFKQQSVVSQFTMGVLNGLLPCGLVYVALTGAIATGSAISGVFYMLLFGIGTAPALLILSHLKNIITGNWKTRMAKAIPYFVVVIGILFILRGMNLGIPYISPSETKLHPHEQVIKGKNLPDCCRKK